MVKVHITIERSTNFFMGKSTINDDFSSGFTVDIWSARSPSGADWAQARCFRLDAQGVELQGTAEDLEKFHHGISAIASGSVKIAIENGHL